MGIKITENGVVNYENEPNVNRELFPNIPEGGGSPEQIAQAVDNWLEDHPEATTTVTDGSITREKLDSELNSYIEDITNLSESVGDLKSAVDSHFDKKNIILGFIAGNYNGSNLTITSSAKNVDVYFPVEAGKKYTIVKPYTTNYWRVGYSSSVPSIGTTLTDYNGTGITTATHLTYTAPVDGYLCAYLLTSDSSEDRESFKKAVYAYEGEYNSGYNVNTATLRNVDNVPENTGAVIDSVTGSGILEDYATANISIVSGYSINSLSGSRIPAANSSYIEIPVVPGINVSGYTRGGLDTHHGCAFYNADGTYISGEIQTGSSSYDWNYDVTAPADASVFRISCVSDKIDTFTAKYSNVFGNTVQAVSAIDQDHIFFCGASRTLNTLKKGIEQAEKYMDSVLYVDAGVYDLVEEFGTDWFDARTASDTSGSGLVLKNRIHIIFSSNSKVVSHYTGTNQYAKSLYSPFNAGAYGFTLENLTIECSNCRYAVHDERNGATEQYRSHYINCNMYIDNSGNDVWTNRSCIGGGLGSNAEVIVENCVFKTDDSTLRGGVYYHQANDASETNYKSSVMVKDNYFITGCIHFDDSRSDSTGNGKTLYMASNNSFPVKYSGTNDENIFVAGMTNPNSVVYAWNNNIRST